MNFEYIFSLPDTLLQQLLELNGTKATQVAQHFGQKLGNFYVDRLVATYLLDQAGLLTPRESLLLQDIKFSQLYLAPDNVLQQSGLTGIVNRFDHMRQLLKPAISERILETSPVNQLQLIEPLDISIEQVPTGNIYQCDINAVRAAIDKYGVSLLLQPIERLATEFGSQAFNMQILEAAIRSLDVELLAPVIRLNLLLPHLVNNYLRLTEYPYIQCLILTLLNDKRLVNEFQRFNLSSWTTDLSDYRGYFAYKAGTHRQCNVGAIQAAIDQYGNRLKDMDIRQLEAEFGHMAFDVQMLEEVWTALNLTVNPTMAKTLKPLILSVANNYEYLRDQMRPELADYLQCLLLTLFSDDELYLERQGGWSNILQADLQLHKQQ